MGSPIVVTLGQQYNVGEKASVIVSHIQRIGCQSETTNEFRVALVEQ